MMIPGLFYFRNFISEDEENRLVASIDSQPWLNDLRRRTQHYGYKYNYTKRSVDSSMSLGPLPKMFTDINALISHLFDKEPDQIIINEYEPGQGINKHVDCVPCFGPVIASLSLLSPCIMEFGNGNETHELLLEPRSLLLLENDARYKWHHRIPIRENDRVGDILITRKRRISATFRTVLLME
jgi:alkylated DNA repair dioxygenase AlkB